MHELIDLGFYIGINGCSLKTEENLSVVKEIPIDKLLLETDSPWCGIKQTHAGFKYVKSLNHASFFKKREKFEPYYFVSGRNEPSMIQQVFDVVSGIKEIEDKNKFAEQIYENTERLLFNKL
jgi:TatD DNase family protein